MIKVSVMRNYFLVAALLMSVHVFAQTSIDFSSDKATKIAKANEKVSSFTSTFTQTKKMSFMDAPAVSEGTCSYVREGNKLCMKYTKPAGELMLINGQSITISRGGKARTMSAKNNKANALANMLLSCTKGEFASLGASDLTYNETKAAFVYTMKVDIEVGKSNISKLELAYSKQDMTMVSLSMIEPDGSYTLYELSGKQLNAKIDDSVFVAPKKK